MKLYEKKIATFSLLNKAMQNNDYSYDIYFRMAVIEKYLQGDNSIWDLYLKMQSRRAKQIKYIPEYMIQNKDNFIKLIDSIKNNGYNKDYPLIVNKDYLIIDGAHRMACCLYFNINEVWIYLDHEYAEFVPSDYSKKWFEDNELNDCIILADIQKKRVGEKIKCIKEKK